MQHLEDLKTVYNAHKKAQNVLVGHCYGSIHILRLLKWLRDEGRAGEIKGMVLISLGGLAPTRGPVKWLSALPAFLLGMLSTCNG